MTSRISFECRIVRAEYCVQCEMFIDGKLVYWIGRTFLWYPPVQFFFMKMRLRLRNFWACRYQDKSEDRFNVS